MLIKKLLVAAVAVGAIIAGLVYLNRPEPVAVIVAPATVGTVVASVANTRSGTVKACRRSRLSLPIGGQVATLAIHKGDFVQTGQVLLELWNKDLQAQLRLAQDDALAVRSRADQACLQAAAAEREGKRKLELKKKGLAAEEEVDRAVTQSQAQQAGCMAAQSDILVSDARVEVASTAVERTILRAPFAGRVAELNAEIGEYVTPSPPGIATPPAVDLIDNTCVYIAAPIDEVDAPAVKLGMEATISLDAFRHQSFSGEVRRIAAYVEEVEKQARTVEVEVEYRDPAHAVDLLPGYSADVEIMLERHENVLRIPTESLLENRRVLVFDSATKTLVDREVTIGISNWRTTEVKQGLQANELVVMSVGRAGVKAEVRAVVEATKSVDDAQ